MLVLSRKQGQSIVIAHDIVVSVVDIGHGRVQIGVTAPQHLPIHREEIHQRIREEQRADKENGMRAVVYSEPDLPAASAGCVGSI
jgi:carbon storage regulator